MNEKDMILADKIIEQLQEIIDPELQVDIVNLGLIYGIDINDDKVIIKMTLTVMGCPLSGYLDNKIKKAVLKLDQVKQCTVKLVWYPVWTKDRMSKIAQRELGLHITPKNNNQKVIDFNTPIKLLADQYSDFVEIMVAVGFTRIKIPGMLNTVGRLMNIKLGAQAMNIDLKTIKKEFEQRGYLVNE